MDLISNIDYYTFWLFFSGLFKDYGTDRQNGFYFSFGIILISLIFEKMMINWLTNRWGCTYDKLQKFTEMEMRYKCINENWGSEGKPPKYDIDSYRPHYFYSDFTRLKERFNC
jgi:hypothetical protein